jgi:hypothetical protein
MIDQQARTIHARRLRSLIQGRITNDEYEDSVPASKDPAVYEIFARGGWHLYGDLEEYRLTGKHALPPESKSIAARWIMFLRSEEPYLWAPKTGRAFIQTVFYLATFGLAFRQQVEQRRATDRNGNTEFWPFYAEEQFHRALLKPSYLNKNDG